MTMTAEAQSGSLSAARKRVLEQWHQTTEQWQATQAAWHNAQERIGALEKRKTPTPSCVKANPKPPPAEEKPPRNQRAGSHHRPRPPALPGQRESHRIVACPA